MWRGGGAEVPAYCRPGLSKKDRAFFIISDMVRQALLEISLPWSEKMNVDFLSGSGLRMMSSGKGYSEADAFFKP